MIAVPPYILLIVYGLFLLFFVFFGLANMFHLAKYGGGTWIGYLVTLLFISTSVIILFVTWISLPPMDWTTPIPVIQNSLPL